MAVGQCYGTAKMEEGIDVFREGKFEMLALTETKLKGNGKISLCGVNGIIGMFRRWKELGKVWPSS